jgi:hypothetical protein
MLASQVELGAAAPLKTFPPAAAEAPVLEKSSVTDLHSLVDLSNPLDLGSVIEAVERVLTHPAAPELSKMAVIRDILAYVLSLVAVSLRSSPCAGGGVRGRVLCVARAHIHFLSSASPWRLRERRAAARRI